MDRQGLSAMWDQLRQIHGVTMRAIERIPADQMDAHPIPNMRSVKELVDHMYVYLRGFPGAVLRGELREEDTPTHFHEFKTPRDLLVYARESFRIADQAVAQLQDKHLEQTVPTFFGKEYSGGGLLQIAYDEHLHHRGQFYAYLRALGIEPPFIWSFEENAPEYQPRAETW